MVELKVDQTVINVEMAAAIEAALSVEEISISLDVGQVIPAVELVAGIQGPEGAKGEKGLKGDKGDALVYMNLTPEEKNEVITQFDNTVGNTSYANVFLNVYLS